MKPLVALLLCLYPALADAGNLYRCVGPAGQVSYQSAICPASQRTDRTIEFAPDDMAPAVAIEPVRTARRPPSNNRQVAWQRAGKPRKPQASTCARAKAKRELQLERLGLKRTFDDLSRIDAAVRAACKGY